MFNNTNRTVFVDTTSPIINFSGAQTSRYILQSRLGLCQRERFRLECSKSDIQLFNSTGHMVNATTHPSGTTSINFTQLDSDMVYYYNVTAYDEAGNSNATATRKITLDSIYPAVSLETPTTMDGTTTVRFR